MDNTTLLLIVLAVALLYPLPFIVATIRSHPNATAIGVCNLFLGWTFLGWVLALVWAFTNSRTDSRTERRR